MPLNFREITPLHKHNIMIICTLNDVIYERLQFYLYGHIPHRMTNPFDYHDLTFQ